PEHADDEAGLVGRLGLSGIAGLARQPRAGLVEFACQVLQAVIGQRDGGRVERVGLDQVGTGGQVAGVDRADDVRSRQAEQVVVATLVVRAAAAGAVRMALGCMRGVESFCETLAAVIGFGQLVLLDHRAHRAIDYEDALGQGLKQGLGPPRGQPGQGVHGAGAHWAALAAVLRAMSAMTSKCGGRRSRVTVSQLRISTPPRVANFCSCFSLKPRLTCPYDSTTERCSWRARLVSSSRPPGRSTRAASATARAGSSA